MSESHLTFKRDISNDPSQNSFGGLWGVEASLQKVEEWIEVEKINIGSEDFSLKIFIERKGEKDGGNLTWEPQREKTLNSCNGIGASTATLFFGQGLKMSFHCPVTLLGDQSPHCLLGAAPMCPGKLSTGKEWVGEVHTWQLIHNFFHCESGPLQRKIFCVIFKVMLLLTVSDVLCDILLHFYLNWFHDPLTGVNLSVWKMVEIKAQDCKTFWDPAVKNPSHM